jgi:hypothetical protein
METIKPAPDQNFLYSMIDAGFQTMKVYPNHSSFVYLMLSRIDEESYE